MANSSGAPPDYEGRIALDPTLLDTGRLKAALETGMFELANTWVHQTLVLHHLRTSMRHSMIFLCEACRMVGNPYCPANLQEISWRDLQWVELEQQVGHIPVQETIVEDEVTGVVTSVVVPDWMETSKEGSKESTNLVDN